MTKLSVSELINDIESSGLQVWAAAGRVMVFPKRKLTEALAKRISAHRLDLLDALEWDWWACLFPEDYHRLTSPQRHQGPCAFCKGITRHSRACDELRAGWQVMRWGKHKGQRVTAVPEDYLAFVLSRRFGTSDDRTMFLDELRRRKPETYGTAAWTAKAIDESETNHE